MKRKILTALLFMAGFAGQAHAFFTPMDRDGAKPFTVKDTGVFVYLSTGQAPYLVIGSTFANAGSSIAVYGVLTSTWSGPAANPPYVELRATNTANITSELLTPPIIVGSFVNISTLSASGYPYGTHVTRYQANNLVVFDPPLVAPDNLCVRLSSESEGGRNSAAVFFRYLATNVPEDLWIPLDDQGQKADASFYGTLVSSMGSLGHPAGDGLNSETFDLRTSSAFVMTSSQPANQSPQLLFGWTASSGSYDTFFELKDATGPVSLTAAPNFLPPIYPRTFGQYNGTAVGVARNALGGSQFNFPWPVIVRQGLLWQSGTWASTERFRFYLRNRRKTYQQ